MWYRRDYQSTFLLWQEFCKKETPAWGEQIIVALFFPSRLVFSGCTLSWFIHLSDILTGHSHIWKGTVWSTAISVPLSKGFTFLFPFFQASRLNCEKGAIQIHCNQQQKTLWCFQRLNAKRSNTCYYWYYLSFYGMVFWVEKKLINV